MEGSRAARLVTRSGARVAHLIRSGPCEPVSAWDAIASWRWHLYARWTGQWR